MQLLLIFNDKNSSTNILNQLLILKFSVKSHLIQKIIIFNKFS